jgi:hypothetical protein
MRRLVHLLILSAFVLGISGGRFGWPDIHQHFRAPPPSCPQFSPYLPCDDDSLSPAQAAQQPLALTQLASSGQDSFGQSCLTWPEFRPVSPKHYVWLGLGAGGLPS